MNLGTDNPLIKFEASCVVLRPSLHFLPKAICSFHLARDIVLLVFFPSSTSEVKKTLHSLDVKGSFLFYLARTKGVQQHFLCTIPLVFQGKSQLQHRPFLDSLG